MTDISKLSEAQAKAALTALTESMEYNLDYAGNEGDMGDYMLLRSICKDVEKKAGVSIHGKHQRSEVFEKNMSHYIDFVPGEL